MAQIQRAQIILRNNRQRLEFIYLPSYSPEFNPIERVWRITLYKVTHDRYFPSTEDLQMALESQFSIWRLPHSSLEVLYERI
jgi:transposase